MTHKNWWYTEGSGMRPLPNEDIEEFAKRITEIAWSNGEFVEREACARVCDDIDVEYEGEDVLATWCSQAIRARGKA